jgi:hypothetical protein
MFLFRSELGWLVLGHRQVCGQKLILVTFWASDISNGSNTDTIYYIFNSYPIEMRLES